MGVSSNYRLLAAMLLACVIPAAVPAQTSDAPKDQSWNSSSSSQNSMGANPTRSSETHIQSGNRTTDKQTLQRMGPDGRYERYLDTEKETVKIDASTTRTVQRSYSYIDGHKQLVQTTEEEARTLPGGDVKTVRTTSNPDANGNLQAVQKEVTATKKTGRDVQETTTSVFTPSISGGLTESLRTRQRETRTGEHTVQFQKTTLLNDGSGNWQTGEVRRGVIQGEGKDQTREENVLQPDSDGKLAVVQHTVTRQASNAGGDTQTTETQSVDLPGATRDTMLHPSEKTTTVHTVGQNGSQSSTTRIEQPNPGSPTGTMHITVQTTDNIRTDLSGAERENRVVRSFNDGQSSAVSVDIGRSEKTSAVNVAPAQTAAKGPPTTPAKSSQNSTSPKK